jgi:hypothetical protein
MLKKIAAFLNPRRSPKSPSIKFQAPGEEECTFIFATVRINLKNPSWRTVLLTLAFMAMVITIIYLLRHSPG